MSVGAGERGHSKGGNRGGLTVQADGAKWDTTQATQLVGGSLELQVRNHAGL